MMKEIRLIDCMFINALSCPQVGFFGEGIGLLVILRAAKRQAQRPAAGF